MRLRTIVLIVAIVPSLLVASDAQAAWWHHFGRPAGLGWSDGYHSRSGCPRQVRRENATFPTDENCPTCQPAVPSQPAPAERLPIPASTRTTWRVATPVR
jgi:hypothetical protein